MRRGLLFILLAGIGYSAVAQNQYHFNQYMQYRPWVNEASMMEYNSWAGSAIYKNQWLGLDGAPTMFGIHALYPFSESSVGSFSIINDQIGVNTSTTINGTYGYRLKIDFDRSIGFSLTGTVNLMSSDYSNISTTISDDPLFAEVKTKTFAMPNFKFGVFYKQKDVYVGFAIPNILENKIVNQSGNAISNTSFRMRNMHYYIVAGFRKELKNPNWELNPSVLIKQASGSPINIDANLNALYKKKFGIGLGYRTSNEILFMMNYMVMEDLKVGYSYDYNLSGRTQVNAMSSGSHEIMVIYQLGKAKEDEPDEDATPETRPTLGLPDADQHIDDPNKEGEKKEGEGEGEKKEGEGGGTEKKTEGGGGTTTPAKTGETKPKPKPKQPTGGNGFIIKN